MATAARGLQVQQFYRLLGVGAIPPSFSSRSPEYVGAGLPLHLAVYLHATSCITCLISILNLRPGECLLLYKEQKLTIGQVFYLVCM